MTGAPVDRLVAEPPPASLEEPGSPRWIGLPGFLAFGFISIGGPLALAAQLAPTSVVDAGASAGLVLLLAGAAFGFPLLIWVRCSRQMATPGGLYGFTKAAAGPKVALVQATLWTVSYLLYLLYTTASIVYDTLPALWPGVSTYQPLLETTIPVALVLAVAASRRVLLAVIGVIAVLQLGLVGILAGVSMGHDAPAGSFAVHGGYGDLASASGHTSLLFVCASLPLFLGGEVRAPLRTIPRGLLVTSGVAVAAIVLAVFPLAANPAFLRAEMPGVSQADVLSSRGLGLAVGAGVALSVAGVMLAEYVATTRLLHAVSGLSVQRLGWGLGALVVLAGPVSLLDPDAFYESMLKPSLVALWLSQLVVFVVYPRFAARFGGIQPSDVVLAAGATAFAGYGLYVALTGATT